MKKLKVGDEILEDDGISVVIYRIVKTTFFIATGVTEYEGKIWPTSYNRFYSDRSGIKPVVKRTINGCPIHIRLIQK